jgi:hypothetical protein
MFAESTSGVGSASEGNTPYNRADSGGSQSISESQN